MQVSEGKARLFVRRDDTPCGSTEAVSATRIYQPASLSAVGPSATLATSSASAPDAVRVRHPSAESPGTLSPSRRASGRPFGTQTRRMDPVDGDSLQSPARTLAFAMPSLLPCVGALGQAGITRSPESALGFDSIRRPVRARGAPGARSRTAWARRKKSPTVGDPTICVIMAAQPLSGACRPR